MKRFNVGDKVQIVANLTIGNPIGIIEEIDRRDLDDYFIVIPDDSIILRQGTYGIIVDESEIRKVGKLGISDLLIDLAYYGGTWDGWEIHVLDDIWRKCFSHENPFSGETFRRSDFPSATYSNNFK